MEYYLKSGPVIKPKYIIGFLDENQDNDYHNLILAGITEAAEEIDSEINIIRFSYYSSHIAYKFSHQVNMVLDHIRQYDLDGLIFLGWTQAGAMYNYEDFMKRFSTIPVLSIGTNFENLPSVYFSGDEFIEKLTSHLIEDHGYTRIAYIEHHRPDNRKDAYINTMRKHGVYDPLLYVGDTELSGLSSEERVKRSVEVLLDERKLNIEAIMSLSIYETGLLINELKKRGMSIPGDIAVTSYGESDATVYSPVGYTTVYFPWKELGYASCKSMIRLLKDGHLPMQTSLSHYGRLVFRESCGCLPYYVKSAASDNLKPAGHGLTDMSHEEIRDIVISMENRYGKKGIQPETIVKDFISSCVNKKSETFLVGLAKALQLSEENADTEELVSDIRKLFYPYLLNDTNMLKWAGDLFFQAQALVSEKTAGLHGEKVLKSRMTHYSLQLVNQALLANFGLQNLINSLEKGMQSLNVGSCYIFISNSIFTGSDLEENLFDNSVLIFKYVNGKRENTTGTAGNLRLQLKEILAQNKEKVSLAYLLHVTDEIMGFALFGKESPDEIAFQTLSTYISTALRGIVLLNRLNITYKKLVEHAYKEGMADIAADILHNMGNILNSINVSARIMEECANSPVIDDIINAGKLLQENLARLEDFICNDVRSKKLMTLYLKLGSIAEKMQNQLQSNLDRIKAKIKTISDTVAAQQNYAGVDTKLEELHVESILEDALKLNQDSFEKLGIIVERKYSARFKAFVNRAKLFYVIFNIIANAKDAMNDPAIKERKLTVSLFEDDTGKYLQISDTGVGIPESTLNRIFDYGFSTKTGKLGFGLYTCATYMADMGGSIRAASTGEGKGACFILKFA